MEVCVQVNDLKGVQLLIENSAVSNHLIMFFLVILQRTHLVKVGSDVYQFLERRMEMSQL